MARRVNTKHIDRARKTSESALNLFEDAKGKLSEANEHLARSVAEHNSRLAELRDEQSRLDELVAHARNAMETNSRVAQRIEDFLS